MRNNEYTATPNWFKQESTDSLANVYQTNYYLTGSTSSGNGILSPINLYNKYIINTYKLTIDDLFIPNTAIIAVDSELPEGLEPPEDFVSEVGNSVSVQDWHTSYSTRVIAGTTIKANLKSNTFRYGIVFYDEHNTPISGYTPTEDKLVEISVPDTANYFRCCHYIDPESESDPFYIEYQSISIYGEDQINEAYSGVFNDFTSVNSDIQEGITKSSVNSRTLNLIFQQPLQFTTDKAGNIKVELNNDVLKDTLLSTDYVTTIENDPLDILSLKDFKQGLKINGIEVVEKNGYVLIKGNLATTGGITAYTEDPDDPDGSGGIGGGGTILDIEIKGEGNALINAYLNEDKSILNFDRGYLMDLTTEQTSTALKTFTEGIKVGDTLIKVIDGVLTLDCSLAVTGGIVAYALDEQIASSIMDAIICDNTTIAVIDGKLTVIGGTGGASNWDELEGKPSWITDTKPTYTWSEITNKPNTLSGYGIQASDVLNTIKSVDGSGSGLDADTLDGIHANELFTSLTSDTTTNLSITIGKTTKRITDLCANSAAKLQTARTIWGQRFDGTANVTGSLTYVTDITGTGTFTGANIKATDSVYVNGIRLHKTADGAVTIEGNLLVTGGITAYADGEDSGGTGGGVIVIDNLTSTLTDAALSANQGRILKGLIDSKVSNWGELEGKPTTIAGYGITDAYTKTECDNRYVNVSGDTMTGKLSITSSLQDSLIITNTDDDGFSTILFSIANFSKARLGYTSKLGVYMQNLLNGYYINLIDNGTTLYLNNKYKFWHEGNDGSDSGLDADTLDGYHLVTSGDGVGVKKTFYFPSILRVSSYIKLGTLYTVAGTGSGSSKVMFTVRGGIDYGGTNESVYEVAASTRGSIQVTSTLVRGNRELKFGYVSTSSNVEIWMAYDGIYRGATEIEVSASRGFTLSMTETTTKPSGFVEGSYRILAATTDNVASASKLTTDAGTATRPVYFSGGIPVAGTYTFGNASGNAAINNGTVCTNLNADMIDGFHSISLTRNYYHRSHEVYMCLGTLTLPQNGYIARLYIVSGNGYNAVRTQSRVGMIILRTSNGYANGGKYYAGHVESYRYGMYGIYVVQNSKTSFTLWTGKTTYTGSGYISVDTTPINTNFVSSTETSDSLPSNADALPIYQVAYTDSNVASATKLQTARNLWGQSFDGTKDVTGSMTVNGNITIANGSSSTLTLWDSSAFIQQQNISDLGGYGLYLYGSSGTRIANKLVVDSTTYIKSSLIVKGSSINITGVGNNGGFALIPGYVSKECIRIDCLDSSGKWITNGIIILSNGYIGIGTTTPSQKLHVVGNILATGGGTFYSSDIRAKTIIERPKLSLNSIANAPVIKFRWNGYNDLKDDNKQHVGGIAQYIEKILPECVVGQKDDFLSFDYATVGYVFSVQTARHLQSYETKTDREIKKLKNRITFLEKQLKKLGYEEVDIMAD